jgi:hypothetical protein
MRPQRTIHRLRANGPASLSTATGRRACRRVPPPLLYGHGQHLRWQEVGQAFQFMNFRAEAAIYPWRIQRGITRGRSSVSWQERSVGHRDDQQVDAQRRHEEQQVVLVKGEAIRKG